MSAYILCDTSRESFFPFTYTRPVADCRLGIFTIREKWQHWLQQPASTLTSDILSSKYPLNTEKDNYWINGALAPDKALIEALKQLKPGERLMAGDQWLMTRCQDLDAFYDISSQKAVSYKHPFLLVKYPWDFFQKNDEALRSDYLMLTKGRTSFQLHESVQVLGEDVFIEEGAEILCSSLNALTGPVYIGKNTVIMEGCHIRGPFALCEGSVVKMGAKIYGATTVGPKSMVGGEVKTTMIFGYSNKAHEGFLGDAVLGEWCNLGGGTSCSNLKNNAGDIKIWNEGKQAFVNAGNKCGILMGDFSRTGINTMINTATVMGISCNVFGGDFPPKDIPSFSWGGAEKLEKYQLEKAVRDAKRWMQLKGMTMDTVTEEIVRNIYKDS